MTKLLTITAALLLCLSAGVFAQDAADTAQYFTTVDAATAAADGQEYMVLDFYTDW